MIALLISPIGRIIAGGLVLLAALTGIYLKGSHDGASRIQAKWDSAVSAAIEQGETARRDAERDIAPATPRELCNDIHNRHKC